MYSRRSFIFQGDEGNMVPRSHCTPDMIDNFWHSNVTQKHLNQLIPSFILTTFHTAFQTNIPTSIRLIIHPKPPTQRTWHLRVTQLGTSIYFSANQRVLNLRRVMRNILSFKERTETDKRVKKWNYFKTKRNDF